VSAALVPSVSAFLTALDTADAQYAANREAMLGKLAEVDAAHAEAIGGGGPRYVERHRARGKLLPRERVELLLDEDSPFLELSTLAAWGTEYQVGGSMVTGIGVVEGVECVIIANDPTVKGGASNPSSLKKGLRAARIAAENRLPVINLVESAGADLPAQKEIFIPGGRTFRDLTASSAARVPTIALVFGSSTAGGAYLPGMSDYVVMVKERARVFLGGPPLVKMATGEESDEESLGGAEMHARTSGLADYLALDEPDAIRIGRSIVRRLNWRKLGSSTARGSTSSSPYTDRVWSPDGRICTVIRSAYWPTPAGCSSARRRRRPRSSSNWRTRATPRCCSCTTPPATWSARSTSRAASSSTAP